MHLPFQGCGALADTGTRASVTHRHMTPTSAKGADPTGAAAVRSTGEPLCSITPSVKTTLEHYGLRELVDLDLTNYQVDKGLAFVQQALRERKKLDDHMAYMVALERSSVVSTDQKAIRKAHTELDAARTEWAVRVRKLGRQLWNLLNYKQQRIIVKTYAKVRSRLSLGQALGSRPSHGTYPERWNAVWWGTGSAPCPPGNVPWEARDDQARKRLPRWHPDRSLAQTGMSTERWSLGIDAMPRDWLTLLEKLLTGLHSAMHVS